MFHIRWMKGVPAAELLKAQKQIGKRLRKYRKAAGYSSYYKFAHEIEMTPSQYAEYERGTNMTMETLVTILFILKVPLAEFFSEGFE